MGVENIVRVSGDGKRQAKRARVLLAAKLKTPFGEVDARLRDLSRKGALVECTKVPPVGSEVVFMRGSTVVPARVAWSDGSGRVGLEFLYMIDENEVLVQLKKTGAGGAQQRFRRPGLNEDLSAKDLERAAAWGVTVGINLPDSDG
ncbi:MAG: PilZ domain-containing protein [Allosphingosinicella sp.]|uniref:PilZ domain-containing protein n=1 Tax=Allosphingosinicella sp. TaxID=2823234 RepID=UPI003942628F